MKTKYILIIIIFILFTLLQACTNINYSDFYPAPPTTNELLQEQHDGQLADPVPQQMPDFIID